MFKPSDFIEKFKEEAEERLQKLNELYINLEADPENLFLIEELLREAHTLKGSSKMVGLAKISSLSHKLEDIFIGIKERKIKPGNKVSDLVFEILDNVLFLTEKGRDADFDPEPLLGACDEVLFKTDDLSCGLEERTLEAKDEASQPGREKVINIPSSEEQYPEVEQLTSHELETIRIKASKVDEILNLIGELVIYQNKMSGRLSQIKTTQRQLRDVGELWVQLKSLIGSEGKESEFQEEQYQNLSALLKKAFQSVEYFFNEYVEDTSRVEMLMRDLHEVAMDMRMLPASYVFSTFPRAVRDMARQHGKEIELIIEGEETRLDKRVLEEINDPLVHILRNAVDHGIETPEERKALGKPEKGTIKMSASQEGDRIIIKISDDGRGIDPKIIKMTAVNRGVITQAEADSMSESEAVYLIFRKEFSTTTTVSDISGRGVGLDVVKLHIEEKLRGYVDMESEVGKGTTFTLILPLTMAIIRALLVRCGGQTFALPTTNIIETLILKRENIHQVGNQQVLRHRDKNINLMELSTVLGFGEKVIDLAGRPAIVVAVGGQKFAYVVERLEGEQPIVIKPLGKLLKRIPNIVGATVLGSGELVMILNVSDLIRNSSVEKMVSEKRKGNGESDKVELFSIQTGESTKRVLVVEDSLTTRELEVSVLKAAGYDAVGVKSGIEAIEMLSHLDFDLVITDILMPGMNGLELIKKIKSDKKLENLPVIVVSSLGSDEDRLKGLEVGADGYFVKHDFDQNSLLDLIDRLVG